MVPTNPSLFAMCEGLTSPSLGVVLATSEQKLGSARSRPVNTLISTLWAQTITEMLMAAGPDLTNTHSRQQQECHHAMGIDRMM